MQLPRPLGRQGCGYRGFALRAALAGVLLGALAAFAAAAPSGGISIVDLTGETPAAPWALANANGSVSVSGVSLPAYVLEVLEDRKVIPNHLLRCAAATRLSGSVGMPGSMQQGRSGPGGRPRGQRRG